MDLTIGKIGTVLNDQRRPSMSVYVGVDGSDIASSWYYHPDSIILWAGAEVVKNEPRILKGL